MTDIERRLRDLGERVREEQGAGALQPNMIRAAKRRRLATALGATLTVVVLVSGVTYAATSLTDKPEDFGPAKEKSEQLIDYHRKGGFEGSDTRLTISPEGHAVLHLAQGTEGTKIEGNLSGSELSDLRDVIAAIDWPAIDGLHDLAPGVGVMDGYEYEIRHENYAVTTISGAELRELKPLIKLLDAVIEIQRALHERSVPSDCGAPIGFEPGYLPSGWVPELQEGGAGGEDPFGNIAGHYSIEGSSSEHEKVEAGFINVVAGGIRFEPPSDGELIVLGQPADLDEENGTVEFGFDGCEFALVGAGVGRDELVPFAEGLRPKSDDEGQQASEQDFAAIWPEDNLEVAESACERAMETSAANNVRYDPESVALEFGALVLGWEEPGVAEVDDFDAYFDGVVLELRRDSFNGDHGPRGPAVRVWTFEVQPDCWSIFTVQRMPDEQPKHDGTMSVRDRDVYMGFDLGGASSAVFEVGYGGKKTTHTWEGGDTGVEFRLDFDPQGKGHFLVLLRNANGEVFSAFGSPLPEGDFAAG